MKISKVHVLLGSGAGCSFLFLQPRTCGESGKGKGVTLAVSAFLVPGISLQCVVAG